MSQRKDLATELLEEAKRLSDALRKTGLKIVFAESCTGGMVAASLAGIPGISKHLCGSAVVYRTATKAQWLRIDRQLLESAGPVSAEATAALARSILRRTPEADLAAAVTGHLGPKAPPALDGRLYIACAFRGEREIHLRELRMKPAATRSIKARVSRQLLASHAVLFMVRSLLESANTRLESRR